MIGRPRISAAFFTIALFVTLITSRRCRAAIAAGPEVPTFERLGDQSLQFELRTGAEAYKKVGLHDPKWDEAAVRFLEEASRTFAMRQGAKPDAEVEQLGKVAIDAGCKDPLVRYHYGRLLMNRARGQEAHVLLSKAAGRMKAQGYPANRVALSIARLYKVQRIPSNPQKSFPPEVEPGLADAVADMVRTDGTSPYGKGERVLLLKELEGLFLGLNLPAIEAIDAAVAKVKDPEPVAALYIAAKTDHKRAWEARGNGWAGEVGEKGGRSFAEFEDKARAALTRAWELDKTVPEPAGLMISVAMSSGNAREMRAWFDRAVAARLDYAQAYEAYSYGLRPRWHGSHEAMLAFAFECFDAGRWDTDLPMYFVIAIDDIRRDQGDKFDVWNEPGVYDRLREACERTAARYDKMPIGGQAVRSSLVGYAIRTNHWADARRVVDQLQGKLDRAGMHTVGLTVEEAVDMAHAFTSKGAREMVVGDALSDTAEWAGAAKAFERAAELAKDDPAAVRHAKSEAQAARWRAAFDAAKPGKWVPLAFEPGLPGWHVHAGKWEVQPDGSVIGETSVVGHAMWAKADFGADMDVSFETEVVGDDPYTSAGGVMFMQGYYRMWYSAVVRPKGQMAHVLCSNEKGGSGGQPAPTEARNRVFASKRGEHVTLWVNGKVTHKATEWSDYGTQWDTRLALGGHSRWDGTKFRFSNLKVRRPIGETPLDGPDAPVATTTAAPAGVVR